MSFDTKGIDELSNQLLGLSNVDEISEKMLEAGAQPILRSMRKRTAKSEFGKYSTGALQNSLKVKKPTKTKTGHKIVVTAEGRDSRGVRNNEKLAYLTYGVHGRDPHPIIAPALKESKTEAIEKMRKVFEEETK